MSDAQLVGLLSSAGCQPLLVQPPLQKRPRSLRRQPLLDIYESLVLSAARRRAFRENGPGPVVYATTTATFFEPAALLRRSAVRFDALAFENRTGPRNVLQRSLERRALRHLAIACPMSLAMNSPRSQALRGKTCIPVPPTIETVEGPTEGPAAGGRRDAICYAANPEKKGYATMLEAWSESGQWEQGARLRVAGIAPEDERRWRQANSVEDVPGVDVVGKLPRAEYLQLVAASRVFISASTYEDFGAAQLEAMAQGAVLATTRSGGPYEAARVLERVRPDLISSEDSAASLARSISVAFTISDEEWQSYSNSSREQLRQFSEPVLRDSVARLAAMLTAPVVRDHPTGPEA